MQCALLMCQIALCIQLRVQQNHAVALLLRQISPHFRYTRYRDQTIGGGGGGGGENTLGDFKLTVRLLSVWILLLCCRWCPT